MYLFPFWLAGLFIRYLILFPLRLLGLIVGWLLFFIFFPVVKVRPCVHQVDRTRQTYVYSLAHVQADMCA